jgi:zinc finger HIT domain-containing protein 1
MRFLTATAKSTLNVRKIIQSQKTFTNHLDDFIALQAQTENNNNGNGGPTVNPSRTSGSQAQANKKAATNRKDSVTPLAKQVSDHDQDVAMTDASGPQVLPPPYNSPPTTHPGDRDPLLASLVPDMPSDEQLRKLLAHPPLSYLAATGDWDTTYPTRAFCSVCGYWGRVRCMNASRDTGCRGEATAELGIWHRVA